MKSHHFIYALFLLSLMSCHKENKAYQPLEKDFTIVIPEGFSAIEFPEDNGFTSERWELGKKLFFDQALSKDQSISCSSCHLPSLAFSDSMAVSLGVEKRPGSRNAPSLANIAYHPYYTREGGVPSLEMQILVPVQEHVEFDFNLLQIVDRLKEDEEYSNMSFDAYERDLDPFVITRAIANYERSLISGSSPYDHFINGKDSALNAREKAGYELFISEKTQCFQCHSGFNFTDYSFQNNGLYMDYQDDGRYRLTHQEKDRARFKTPTLRNVALTAPYMHNGSIRSLEEVIDHYNSGGKDHPQKSPFIRKLHLSQEEKGELLAFLESLTDMEFIQNAKINQP